MQAYLDRLSDIKALKFINQVGDLFKNFPKLPSGLVDFIVKIIPYLALLGALLSLFAGPVVALLGVFGSVVTVSPFFLGATLISAALSLAQAVLLFVAFKPLQDRVSKGWIFLFWAEIVATISSVVSLFGMRSDSLLFTTVFSVFWFYILFQLRPRYS